MGKKPVKAKKGIKTKNKMTGVWILFSIILLSALVMRLYQPDWYNERQFHPDERWIVGSAVPSIKYWGDKPIGLQYGSLPLYILATYNDVVRVVRTMIPNMDMNKALIGGARAISGLVDTGTIVFIFLICLLVFTPSVALFASALLAFTALHLHASHFFTVDTFATFFSVGMMYFALRIYKKGTLVNYILAGAFYGMAIASKSAALPFAAAILVAQLFRFFSMPGKTRADKQKKIESWINLIWAGLTAVVVFFICMPHAFLSMQQFIDDQNNQKRILITGEADVPFNRQYLNTTPYLFYMENLVKYTMGPYGAVALFAFFFYIAAFFKNLTKGKIPGKEIAVILAGVLPYFLIVGTSFAKFNRYMIPFTPFLALLAAKLLFDFYAWTKNKKIAGLLIALTTLSAIFYGLAFMNVYTNSHTWIQASRWMIKEIPVMSQGTEKAPHRTRILNEQWGDDLPVGVDGHGSGDFENLKWALQEPDSPNKIEELSRSLSYTDYVIMADKRAYGTYQRLPQRYPINFYYYSNMIKNADVFGYKMVLDKVVYPSLFGIDIKDDKADESYQLYDHPRVYIFQNIRHLKQEEIKQIILNGKAETEAKYRTNAQGQGSVSSPAKRKDMNNPNIGQLKNKIVEVIPQLSIFLWYILIQLLAFMVLPLNFTIFKNLKDKGYGMAKVAGVFLFVWINWMLVSLNVWKFYQLNLWILIAVLFAAAAFFTVKNKKEITGFASENKKYILVTEALFLGAYLLFILIKIFCPDVHNIVGHGYNGGGEPMGMAYLSAIYNDVKFPPHDPWMSGFTLNYYYWGQLLLATVSKALGYAPKITYNLSLSILFALSFIAAFSLSYNMTGKYKYGIFGGFLLACAGNFHTLYFMFDKMINASGLQNIIAGIMSFQFIWDPTRIYPSPVITEMPFFSYLYGDLHAHNIVIPVTVLAVALVYNILKSPNTSLNFVKSFGENKTEVGINIFVLSVVVGSMLAINTWNYPPVAIFLMLSLFMLAVMLFKSNLKAIAKMKAVQRPKVITNFGLGFLVTSVLVMVLAYLAFLPFHMNFQSPFKVAIGVVSKPERANLYMMFEYFALFFIVIFAFAFMQWSGAFEEIAVKTGMFKLKMKKFKLGKVFDHIHKIFDKISDNGASMLRVSVFTIGVVIFLALLFVQPTFAFIFAMLATVTWALVVTTDRNDAFALVLLFTALGVIVGTELFFIADGRMNTVFKFYMVAWTLLACSVPYLLKKVVEAYKKILVLKKHDVLFVSLGVFVLLVIELVLMFVDSKNNSAYFKIFFISIVVVTPAIFFILKNKIGKFILFAGIVFLLVPAVLYPIIGAITKGELCSINPAKGITIDGTAYMKNLDARQGIVTDFNKFDYEAIEWINANITQIDPILEAPGDRMYSGLSRVSIYTGMPSFIGWSYQVSQQSGRDEVPGRSSIANEIYTNKTKPEVLLNTLQQNGIKYVYVGGIEKLMYPNAPNFALVADAVYNNQEVTIYKVK